MFGRIRKSSSSSADSVERERPFSKITKDDSLSIYENTLLMLKLGSQRGLKSDSSEEQPLKMQTDPVVSASPSSPNNEVIMATDSADSSSPASESLSCEVSLNQPRKISNLSVVSMFSKYETTRQGR